MLSNKKQLPNQQTVLYLINQNYLSALSRLKLSYHFPTLF
mgnify:CR=1 FL=1